MLQFFRKPALSESAVKQIQFNAEKNLGIKIDEIATEWCFYIQSTEKLDEKELAILRWLLVETFEPSNFSKRSSLGHYAPTKLEVGPRLNFETAWSTTAVSICHACGLSKIVRMERSLRLGLSSVLTQDQKTAFLAPLYDRMTQMYYPKPLESFETGIKPEPVQIVPVIERGIDVLKSINTKLGLAMDDQDIQMFYKLVVEKLKRNSTDVEIAHYATCNNEHSRHGYFKGKLIINGQVMDRTLMEIVKNPWRINPGNSLIAFCDDS